MARYVYVPDENGNPKPHLASARRPLKGTPPEATMGFQETILNAYKEVESKGGYWPSSFSKSLTKRAHETAAVLDAFKAKSQ